MNDKAIAVRTHSRAPRRDRVGELLAGAANLQKARTVRDWAIEWSRKNDDETLPASERFFWHLDPVELRSVVTQAQQRLRQAADPVIITDKDTGKEYEIEPAVAAGAYAHLLGTKLFPSAKTGKPGKKEPRWCDGITPMEDREAVPDGLSFPPIVELKRLAAAAGDNDLSNLKAIATMPARARKVAIAEKKRDYLALIKVRGENGELRNTVERKDAEILRLTNENTGLRQEVQALQDLRTKMEGIDFERLAQQFGRQPPEAGASAA